MNLLPARMNGHGVQLASGATLSLGGLGKDEGDVVVGIRPDDLQVVTDSPIVEGRVTVQEPLGPETLIYVDLGGSEVIAKADGRAPPAVGSTVRLGALPENIHVIDGDTGAALR
jgi:multiple sugar transport system ATP-binding protein